MIRLRASYEFMDWIRGLRDRQGRSRVLTRLFRLVNGNSGQSRSVGGGIVELKIDFGPGYRVYFLRRGETLVLLLCGGDKSTQQQDIERAKELASRMDEGDFYDFENSTL